MSRRLGFFAFVLAVGMFASDLRGEEPTRGVVNWPAPLFWSPGVAAQTPAESRDEGTIRAKSLASVPTSPLPLIGITPCRIVDTRDATRPPSYGPPPLAPGVGGARNFTLTGQCGIAVAAQAVSLNITVTNTLGPGYIVIYPQDGDFPPVSTLNYFAGQTVANAALVPLGTAGGITVVAGVSGTDLIIDTNGYYAGAGVGFANTFLGTDAGNDSMTGDFNTAIGSNALHSNTTGLDNTAAGAAALFSNTTGSYNTATGLQALLANTTGSSNTAAGYEALYSNTEGFNNTATGFNALFKNTFGLNNTASGYAALYNNTDGADNTAIGSGALYSTRGGAESNTAIGSAALYNHTTSDGNIAIGAGAGYYLTAGGGNMYLGSPGGDAIEGGTIRIGNSSHSRAFIDGVRGKTTGNADAIPVLIDSSGQLGTVSSSGRFKVEVEDMADDSSKLLKLRPVTFRYKGQVVDRRQFGLIAEEVQEVLPELVVCDSSGEAETVLYHEMPAMLVNELQKQQRLIEQQRRQAAAQQEQIDELLARLLALDGKPNSSCETR